MNKPFEIEFYHKGDVIDLKSYDVIPNIPGVGDQIYLECENPSMNVEGDTLRLLTNAICTLDHHD